MKNYLRNLLVFVFFAIGFTACQNFFNSELKEKLDEAVEIANSRSLTVELNLRNSNSGTIVPQGFFNVKKGEVFKFEFTVKNGYDFDGTFNVWQKNNGKNTKILDVSEVFLFERKSEHNAGVGSTNYSYEAKILKDDYDSFLINPSIFIDSSVPHPETFPLPVIREMKVTNRYGDRELVDYFDLDLYVEDKESVPKESISIDFYDVSSESGSYLCASVEYDVIPEDIGNGNYLFHTTVDLRNEDLSDYKINSWGNESGKYKFTATVENEIGPASKSYNKILKRQSYSKTKVQVYNYYDLKYDSMDYSFAYNQRIYSYNNNDFKQNPTEFFKTLKLMVREFDKEGFGFLPDGRKSPIKYGFCQNSNEIETLELNNIILDYNAFDFESEYNEMQPLWYEASQIYDYPPTEPTRDSYYFYENGDKENGAFLEDKYNEAVEEYNEAVKEYYQVRKPHYEWVRAECNAGYQKYERKGEQDKAIINIPIPSNLDPKKDIYIKVTTEDGINEKNFEVFTISAPPKLESIELKPNNVDESLNYVSLSFFDNASPLIRHISPTSESYDCSTMSGFYEAIDKAYPFYVYSHNSFSKTDPLHENLERQFHLCSYAYDTYTTEKKELPLKKFSSDAELVEIKSAGKGTGTQIISVKTDRDVFNQFDRVFYVKYEYNKETGEWKDSSIDENNPLSLSDDNKISYSLETYLFYDGENTKDRVEYGFGMLGVKNGIKYWMDSPYIITKNDTRVEDNVPPHVNLEPMFDMATFSVYIENIVVDHTGSFLTIQGYPVDVGGNLGETIDVSIKIVGSDGDKVIEMTNCPVDKYLSIPISDLKNDKYQLYFTLSDTEGNSGTNKELVPFLVNRKTVSMNEIEKLDSSFKIKDNSDTKLTYSLNYFDTSKNDWGIIEKRKSLNKGVSSEIAKTGFFQLRIEKEQSFPADNYVSYPYLFHFPEKMPNEKDFLLLQNSVRVYTDQSFFIHTLKSDIDWGKDVDAWENHQSFSYVMDEANYVPFEGSEVNPVYKTGDYSSTPYSYHIPWDKLDKKYAAIVIIWGDNNKSVIPIDMSKKY